MDVFAPYWFDPPADASASTDVTVRTEGPPVASIPQALLRERIAADLGSRYELDAQVGEGGMATVWRARDRVTGDLVAVKALNAAHAQPGRFYREVSVQFRLRHPKIVPILNLLEAAERRYLILEYCAGGTLRDLLRQRRKDHAVLPPSRVASIARDLAEALDAAHSRGLAHRDLKPANVLFDGAPEGRDGAWPTARVADFGLARVAGRYGTSSDGGPRSASGSPVYMAPEQFTGGFCRASDLYALGVVCHEMLRGDVPARGGFDELVKLHREGGVRVDRSLPAPWDDLLPRLLHRDPRQRPSDGAEVVRMLSTHCTPHPMELVPTLTRLIPDATSHSAPDERTATQSLAAVLPAATRSGTEARRVVSRTFGVRPLQVLVRRSGAAGPEFVVVAPEGVFLVPADSTAGSGTFVAGPRQPLDCAALDRDGRLVATAGRDVVRLTGRGAWETLAQLPSAAVAIAVTSSRLLAACPSRLVAVDLREPGRARALAEAGPGRVLRSVATTGAGGWVAHVTGDEPGTADGHSFVYPSASGADVAVVTAPEVLGPVVGLGGSFGWVARTRRGPDEVVTLHTPTQPAGSELPYSADLTALTVDAATDGIHGVGSDGVLLSWSPDGELVRRRSLQLDRARVRALAVDGSRTALLLGGPRSGRLEIHEDLPAGRSRSGLHEVSR